MPGSPDTSTPVVVLHSARHGSLGITRTLGRMGVPVYHIDRSAATPSFHSRYSRGQFLWDVEKAATADSLAFLGKMAAAIGRRAILIPTSDGTAMWVARHATALRRWFDFPSVDAKLVRILCSKREMSLLAGKLGVPTPETTCPQSRDELIAYAQSAKFPVMAKGIFGIELERIAGKRMFLIRDRQELLELYDTHGESLWSQLILQEFIPGSSDACWMFNGYFDRSGECVVAFTGRKIRQYPAEGGLTSLGECRHNQTIVRLTRDLVRACGYQGIVDVDYKYDQRDGQYKILDINPRVGATFRLFVGANGMDVVRALYLDLTCQEVKATPAKEGRRWLVEDCDLVSSFQSIRGGKLGWWDWLQSFRGVAETGILALDDPYPTLWMGVRHVQRLWKPALHPLDAGGSVNATAADRPTNYQASRLVMLTRNKGLERSDSSIS